MVPALIVFGSGFGQLALDLSVVNIQIYLQHIPTNKKTKNHDAAKNYSSPTQYQLCILERNCKTSKHKA